jgi:hypothetical protein
MDLGNRTSSMCFQCHACDWRPPGDMKMEAFQLHCQVEHDTDEVQVDLVAVCTCGAAMTSTGSRPTGGGFKDYFRCGACGNTAYVRRTE